MMACRAGSGAHSATIEGSHRKSTPKKTPTRARAGSDVDDLDDAEFGAVLERMEAWKQDLAASELALRESQLAHEHAMLEVASARRSEDFSECLQREARNAEDADTARFERSAFTRAIIAQ